MFPILQLSELRISANGASLVLLNIFFFFFSFFKDRTAPRRRRLSRRVISAQYPLSVFSKILAKNDIFPLAMFRRNPQERFTVENAICSTAVSAISMAKKSVYCNVTLVFSDSFFNPLREKHMCALQRFSAKCLETIVKYGYYHRRQKKVAITEKSVYRQKHEQAATYDVVGARSSCI